MVKSKRCEKSGLKKGPWAPDEDEKLLAYIQEHGHGSWRALPHKAGLQRCGKSCRLRWTNYLRPDIKRGKFSLQEEQTIIQLHALLGNRWSAIANHLSRRTDNEIKNYWNTHLKKRLNKMGIDPVTHKPKADAFNTYNGNHKIAAHLNHMAQWESARLEAEARLVRESKLAVNPLKNQLIGSSASAPLVTNEVVAPRLARPQCLDVLKAWQGVVSGMFFAAAGCDNLESPTSTLNFSENALVTPASATVNFNNNSATLTFANNSVACNGTLATEKEFNSGNDWKSYEKPNQIPQMRGRMDGSIALRKKMNTNSIDNVWFANSSEAENENAPIHENVVGGLSEIFAYNSDGHVTSLDGEDYWNGLLDNLVDASNMSSSYMF